MPKTRKKDETLETPEKFFKGNRCTLKGEALEKEMDKFYTYLCGDCLDEKTGNSLVLKTYKECRDHAQDQHEKFQIKAKCCGKTFSRRDRMIIHLRVHLQPTNFKCIACNIYFESEDKLRSHKLTRHATYGGGLTCNVCQKQYPNLLSLRQHKFTHTVSKLKCPICGKECAGPRNLSTHKSYMHSDKYKCTICSYATGLIGALKSHMQSHTQKMCSFCPSEFKNSIALRRHLKEVHNELEEPESDESVAQLPPTEDAPVSRHFCGPCDIFLFTESELQEHIREVHPGPHKQHLCPHCGKLFASANHLWRHTKQQHGTHTFECSGCDYVTGNQNLFKVHVEKAHGDRYCCTQCPEKFGTRFFLFKHEREVHKPSKTCTFCGKVFQYHSTLNRHLRRKHKMGVETSKPSIHTEAGATEHIFHDNAIECIAGFSESPRAEEDTSIKQEIHTEATVSGHLEESICYDNAIEYSVIEDHKTEEDPCTSKIEPLHADTYEVIIESPDTGENQYVKTEKEDIMEDISEVHQLYVSDVVEIDDEYIEEAEHIHMSADSSSDEENEQKDPITPQPKGSTKKAGKKTQEAFDTCYSYRCEQCLDDSDGQGLQLGSYEEMVNHFQGLHNIEGYGFCCGKKISTSGFGMHLKSHTSSRSCPHCSVTLRSLTGLKKHVLFVHNKMLKAESSELMAQYDKFFKYDCEGCPELKRKLMSFDEMRCHFEEEHQSVGYVFCCDLKIARNQCRAHLGYHLTPEKYTCPKCHIVMFSMASLGRHVNLDACREVKEDVRGRQPVFSGNRREVGNERSLEYDKWFKFYCEDCNESDGDLKKLRNVKEMRHHFKTMHKTQGYGFCCGKKICASMFPDHLLCHTETSGFQCPYCPKMMRTYKKLTNHIRNIHRNVKRPSSFDRRRCGLCDIRFETYKEFLSHRKDKHEQQVSCELCGKTMANKKGLTQHIKECHPSTDTAMVELICPYCEKVSKTKEALRLHVRNNHTNPDIICPHCNFTTKFGRCMKLHLVKHSLP